MDHLFYSKSPSTEHLCVTSMYMYVVTSFANNLHLYQSYVTILRCSFNWRADCPTNACLFYLRAVDETYSSRVYIYLLTFRNFVAHAYIIVLHEAIFRPLPSFSGSHPLPPAIHLLPTAGVLRNSAILRHRCEINFITGRLHGFSAINVAHIEPRAFPFSIPFK